MALSRFKLSNVLIYAFLALFALFCFGPMLLVLMISITSEDSIRHNGYSLFPNEMSFAAYRMLFNDAAIVIRSYGISLFVTVVGTLSAVGITGMASYTLFNRAVRYRNHLALFFFFTMLFNGGIVPWYMICRQLGLNDNILALLIPSLLFSAFNLFLTRNYMLSLPYALVESAKIDGANDAVIAFRIIFPLCKPVLATIALFYGLAYWNDWWNAIMLVSDQKMYPVQYFLFKLQSDIQMMTMIQGVSNTGVLPTESVKMATAILTIGPIVLMYPYLQRYFVKGLVVGSIKG
ncbi:carbohydrate ABC transporter permease [Cohnella herbarum]|uniref:Carbohydrate ABC transporter permease n=1 Tax=Cohnella herbarum TaxID=2728023 RepID=A0A7Z2VP26_9BACL|nr:carbohydrate ABC transporter permease [Cohnella herbarum]QJD86474.1 carbohydrate ABC transporter permease [Cohnella herbarum]